MEEIFAQEDITHNLRRNLPMRIPKARISSYGIESLSFLGCNLTDEFKSIKTLASLKRQIKAWNDNCKCKLCRNSLVMSDTLINSIDLHFILHLHTSFIFLLCKYIIIALWFFVSSRP